MTRPGKKQQNVTQIPNIRNERRNITTDTADIKRVTCEYYEPLYLNKLDNLDERDKFLDRYKLPKLT